MRYAFLGPLFLSLLLAIGLLGGEARPEAPYIMTALLGAAWAAWRLRGEA